MAIYSISGEAGTSTLYLGRFNPQTPTVFDQTQIRTNAIAHTRLGIALFHATDQIIFQPYDLDEAFSTQDVDLFFGNGPCDAAAHQSDLLYLYKRTLNTVGDRSHFAVVQITDNDEVETVASPNINHRSSNNSTFRDMAIYRDTLYLLDGTGVHTLDIKKYRPVAKRTKTTIYPQFIDEGGTLDLTQFSPDAERIVFDVGYRKPPFLSINNANNEIRVAASAVSSTTPVFVRCLGINRIDSQPFSFYLVIRQAASPAWRDLTRLSMRANSSYNMFQIVDGADSVVFRSGRTQPTGSSINNGVFTIGTVGGQVSLTARKGSQTAHTEFEIDVVQDPDPANFSDTFRHTVEIAGIDVTADVEAFPVVSKSLDVISLNEYRANEVRLSLKSGSTNNYRYNDDIPDNFWTTHGLNPGGFQVPIRIYIESLVNGNYISHLLFAGVIDNSKANFNNTLVELRCLDISTELERTLVQAFGTLEKWDTLRQKSDESNFQGVYTPEASLLPMQIGNAEAWSHRQRLTIRQLAIPSEGPPIPNAAYITPTEFFTSDGLLDENPIVKFKTHHRSEDVRFLINQIALNKKIYNTEINLPAVQRDMPFLLNRGNIPFSVENTRNTRVLTDWVYDSSNDRLLILLSNPESHICDLLVQYDLNSDSYRVLHTFDKDTAVHRIERRSGTHYYILSSSKITENRSARQLPRPNDSTGYAYDSLAEDSEIKIYHYSTSSGTLTEHVAEDDTYPPQLGIHYWAGFENDHYIDTWEGIRADYRGAFKWQGSHLYYRYAKDGEFGVARVNTSGTTAKMIGQAVGKYQNHLNFAFDITSGGTIYFVYAEGDTETSTLVIKRRTSGGTESTILSETRGIGDFNELGLDFGAFLGAYEVLFHNNNLHILVPIQKADLGDDTQSIVNPDVNIEQLTAEKSGERNVTTSTNLNPSNLILAPGDDIPLRIDFDGSVSGATQDDLTVYGGTIQSFSISSDMIDVTIRPDNKARHKNITIDLAEDAVDQTNEAWRIVVNFGTTRSRTKAAGMALYKCNVTGASPTLTTIETWDFVQLGGCNLVVHDSAVHFMEHPPASVIFKPINPDLDGYWADAERTQTMGYNVLPDPLGALKKVNSNGDVESLGNLWYEERPYSVSTARCLSFDDELHLTVGYGNPDELLRYSALASKPDNFQHLVYGKKLHYVVPEFDSNGSRYALLADIAKKTNATLSFRNGLITIRDRDPFRALTDGSTGTGTGNLDFDNQNKRFPSSGYLLIEKELLQYTGLSGGAFTGIQRGVLGTQIVNHPNNTPVLYLDTVIEENRLTGGFPVATDATRIHNVIRNSDNTIEESDAQSISAYGELPYPLDLGLTQHDLAWQEHIFENYLENLKDPHPLINLILEPSFYLDLEQFIGFRYDVLVYGVQIVSITYSKDSTTIRGRVL